LVKLVKGNRKSTKIVEYQLICIDYRWICINYQALVLETFFCLSKRWLFLICDIILDYREALVFYRIFSTLVINFFEFLKFGSKSIEKSIENRYQSTSVTVNFTDNRDYRAVLYSMVPGNKPRDLTDWPTGTPYKFPFYKYYCIHIYASNKIS